MDKITYKIFFVVLVFLFTFNFSIPWSSFGIDVPFTGKEYKLGLDLQWGIELDYKVDLEEVRKDETHNVQKETAILEGLKSIIDKRVEALNINDSIITTATYGNDKHIIVQIPLKSENREENNTNILRAKEAIGRVMKIEFKEQRTSVTPEDKEERKNIAEKLLSEAQSSKYSFPVTSSKYKDSYENVESGTLSGTLKELSAYFVLPSDLKTGIVNTVVNGTGASSFDFENGEIKQVSGKTGYYVVSVVSFDKDIAVVDYAFVDAEPSEWKPAQDSKGRILNDKYFVNSSVQQNQAFQPMVELTFNNEWAEIFGELTTRLQGKPIAIFVWGNLLTAPTVNDAILTGKAVITGDYTYQEAQQLANDINTWVVPAPIYLTSERTIDSRLGKEALMQLAIAGFAGFVMIFAFLLLVYRWAGFAAGIALIIYTFLLLAIVKWLGLTLTMASIAGLILSVWIAIDANILIFERIKDELKKKNQKLHKSVTEGFEKSWSAIWDSNLTGIIISVILFVFWVNLIKWFGLMLGLWIVVSLFTAMFVSRLFVLFLTRNESKVNLKSFIWFKE